MKNFILKNLIWMHGRSVILISLVFAVLGIFVHPAFYIFSGIILWFGFYFFRNPERSCTENWNKNDVIISPADGKVVDIQISEGSLEGFDQKISIFLSPLDVHVNWIPVTGKISKVIYRPGKFVPAFVPKSSELNERNDIIINTFNNQTILVRQIAGTVARKILCWVKPGIQVFQGQKYGMIKFGSRVDILLPKNIKLEISIGERVHGGKSIIGRWLC